MSEERKTRVYRIETNDGRPVARYTDDEPADWNDAMGLFHKNDSSWCASNVFDNQQRVEVLDADLWNFYFNAYKLCDACPCFQWKLKIEKQN